VAMNSITRILRGGGAGFSIAGLRVISLASASLAEGPRMASFYVFGP